MIKAIIFDLNGIFIQSPKLSDRFHDKFGVSIEEFLPVLKEIMAIVRKPNAGHAFNYWKSYLERWGVNLTKEQFFDFWFSAEKENTELVKTAKQIKKKGIKIFILSNNFLQPPNTL
jgi:phosphoserine phosphatase